MALVRAGARVALLTLLVTAAACGSREAEITPLTLGADTLLFERGTAALEAERWLEAREYFIQIRDFYPQSVMRADARLGVADTYLGQRRVDTYVLAAVEYRDFLSLYPTHPRAPAAQYRLGLVFFRQMRSAERDQTETLDAIREFEVFLERYPESELTGEVLTKIREARDRFSESNFSVGRYYYRNKWYPGAIDRFLTVLTDDPGYSQRELLYFFLGDAYRLTGRGAEALPLLERLVEEFPETRYLEQAAEAMTAARTQIEEAEEADAFSDTTEAGAAAEPDPH
jgi:outer membrane protein assembly factor BamD